MQGRGQGLEVIPMALHLTFLMVLPELQAMLLFSEMIKMPQKN